MGYFEKNRVMNLFKELCESKFQNCQKCYYCVRFKLTLAKLILDYIEADFFHFIRGKIQRKDHFQIKDNFLLKILKKGNMDCTLLNPNGLLNKIYANLKKDGNNDTEEEEEYDNDKIEFNKKKGQKRKIISDKKAMKCVKLN